MGHRTDSRLRISTWQLPQMIIPPRFLATDDSDVDQEATGDCGNANQRGPEGVGSEGIIQILPR